MDASERLRLEASRERDRAVGHGIDPDEYAAFRERLADWGSIAVAYLAWRRGAWADEMADLLEAEEVKAFEDEDTQRTVVIR